MNSIYCGSLSGIACAIYPQKKAEKATVEWDSFAISSERGKNEILEINREIAKKAAQIRAEYKGFKAMDALQLAAACLSKCDLFLTNDKQLGQFKEMKCLTVEELE